MVHPGSQDWQAALQEANIPAGASIPSITTAVHSLGLDWWFIEATGNDIFGTPTKIIVARIWKGVGSPRPDAISETPKWNGYSERSRDEALGLALRAYFSTL